MRYIPTSDDTVERLKKQAKKLQRNGAGKHAPDGHPNCSTCGQSNCSTLATAF